MSSMFKAEAIPAESIGTNIEDALSRLKQCIKLLRGHLDGQGGMLAEPSGAQISL